LNAMDIKIPDLGGAKGVRVIEVLIRTGDLVRKEQTMLTLESDKATMDVPAPQAGTIASVLVKVGDVVDEGKLVATMSESANTATIPTPIKTAAPVSAPAAPAAAAIVTKNSEAYDVAVLGAGPGGYTAAFRAADLGLKVVLIERYPTLGGVCLNVGCIPSKALLHSAKVMDEAASFAELGIRFAPPKIELDALRKHKDGVVGKLTGGLQGMAKQRGVTVVQGTATFSSPYSLDVQSGADLKSVTTIQFKHAIIAAGSQAVKLPGLPWGDTRLMDSTDALMLSDIPKRLLVIGGGIIGLEMATVYDALGAKVTVVELQDQLMPGADMDLVKPLQSRISKHYEKIMLQTKVVKLEAEKEGLRATFDGPGAPAPQLFDRVLCAVGRSPNGKKIAAEKAGVAVTDRGFINVDKQMRTNVPHIFAIGDIVGNPMLAHKATHEAKVAAEVIAGHKVEFVARVIPSVAYTDPEIAWAGVTELDAKAQGLDVGVAKFPFAASGRAIGINRTEGFSKLIFDKTTGRVIGGAVVGPTAGDMICEIALAIEMGADAHDIGLTIHPHPTLGETVGMAAEVYNGSVTDIVLPKKKA
jgi:dihydrolipoamide dehydrogenase